jgi:hypothetical protein
LPSLWPCGATSGDGDAVPPLLEPPAFAHRSRDALAHRGRRAPALVAPLCHSGPRAPQGREGKRNHFATVSGPPSLGSLRSPRRGDTRWGAAQRCHSQPRALQGREGKGNHFTTVSGPPSLGSLRSPRRG